MRKLPNRTLNVPLSDQLGREVVMIDALPLEPGHVVRVQIESSESSWRQGVRLATDGVLMVNGVSAPQLDLWQDTAPGEVEITCDATDGLLRVYNVWQSGRRPGVESRSATSGMLVDEQPDGSRRYACNDIGLDPDFSKLIFRLSVE